jgi:hypothetical protein
MIKVTRTGPWDEVAQALGIGRRKIAASLAYTTKAEAEFAAKKMREAIDTAGVSNGVPWPALSQWTSLAKGHSRQLIDSRRLSVNIRARLEGTTWVAGPAEGAHYAKGQASVADVTRIHEEGASYFLELTARMAAFLAIRAKELGIPPNKGGTLPIGSRILIKIPRRSFILDTKKAHFGNMQITKRFIQRTIVSSGILQLWKHLTRSK